MKRNRRLYVVALTLAGILVYLIPGIISATLFYMLILMPVSSLIYTIITYSVFKVKQEVDIRHVLKGNVLELTCSIYNDSPFIFPPMLIDFIGSNMLFTEPIKVEEFVLTPRSHLTVTYPLQCKYRGAYAIGIRRIRIIDPFRLFTISFRQIEPIKIMVYPHITKINPIDDLLEHHQIRQHMQNRLIQEAHSLSDIRPYGYGDRQRNIHWKASARLQQWMVKHRQENLGEKAVIIMDTQSLDIEKGMRLYLEDYIIERAVGYVKAFLDYRIPTRLMYAELRPYDQWVMEPKGFPIFYHQLAGIQYKPEYKLTQAYKTLLHEKYMGQYLGQIHLFTLDLSSAMLESIRSLVDREHQIHVHYVINPTLDEEALNSTYQLIEGMIEQGISVNPYMP